MKASDALDRGVTAHPVRPTTAQALRHADRRLREAGLENAALETALVAFAQDGGGSDASWGYALGAGIAIGFAGLTLAIWRWKEPKYAFLLLWLGKGKHLSQHLRKPDGL